VELEREPEQMEEQAEPDTRLLLHSNKGKNMAWLDFLKPAVCPELSSLQFDRQVLLSQLEQCKAENVQIPTAQRDLAQCKIDLAMARKNLSACQELVPEPNQLEDYWNNKYPKANIEYTGRTFPTTKEMIPIDVRLLLTPQDFHIHTLLEKYSLKVAGGNYDETVIKIYKWIYSNFYKYITDQQNYGIPELWEFPFEILAKKASTPTEGFDCDSWANFQASFYIAAGVPNWKIRVVAGNSNLGGHATVYVHSDKDNRFHHVNSTYGATHNVLSDYPIDASHDDLFINDVWFSWNDKIAWHQFTTEASNSFFNHKEGISKFHITTQGDT
jgi:hypothetical protein